MRLAASKKPHTKSCNGRSFHKLLVNSDANRKSKAYRILVNVHAQNSPHLTPFDIVIGRFVLSINIDDIDKVSFRVSPKEAAILQRQGRRRMRDALEDRPLLSSSDRYDVDAGLELNKGKVENKPIVQMYMQYASVRHEKNLLNRASF